MIDFWLFFPALVIALFSVGRLVWPDPDNSVSERSEEQLKQLRIKLSGKGIVGVLRKIVFAIVYL